MEAPSMQLTGGCQCGAVRYQVTVAGTDAYFCHCRMCQRAFGNLFATLVLVRKTDVAWTRGAPAYFASSKLAKRGFCGACGTPLTFEYLAKQSMDLSVGSLDEPGQLRPVCHNGVESRIAAFAWPDQLPQSRTEDNAEYVATWQAAYGAGARPGPVTG